MYILTCDSTALLSSAVVTYSWARVGVRTTELCEAKDGGN